MGIPQGGSSCTLFPGHTGIWNVGFSGGWKTGVTNTIPTSKGREPKTNSTHMRHQVQESNLGHGSERRGPLPLCHPCFLKSNGYEEADVLGPELLIHLIFLLCLQLKKSHIRPPIPEEREFSTTHQRTYTPKKTSRRSVNPGSLQRSSIPLGTLNTYV